MRSAVLLVGSMPRMSAKAKPVAVRIQFFAHSVQALVSAEHSAQQQVIYAVANVAGHFHTETGVLEFCGVWQTPYKGGKG